MPRLKSSSEIQYLSFQGGGGKGFAYLGVIEALEALKVLPVRPGSPGQVLGISGSSAGAMTAMLVACGGTAADFKKIFSDRSTFDGFFDGPDKGYTRGLLPDNYQAKIAVSERGGTGESILQQYEKLLKFAAKARTDSAAPAAALLAALGSTGQKVKVEKKDLTYAFRQKQVEYVFNFVYDRGLFPGFNVRAFLRNQLRTLLTRMPVWRRNPPIRDAGAITFGLFKDLTGVDLAVTGTNISQQRSQMFSASETPQFPVAEAVGISACFPFVWKPVYIKSSPSDPVLGNLRGLWIDGGLLNNMPIHAFDDRTVAAKTRGDKSVLPLNPYVLGLKLVEGAPMTSANYRDPEVEDWPILGFAKDVFQTVFVPGNQGQLRSLSEAAQTIDIFSYDLSVLDLAPSLSAAGVAINDARIAVLDYFKPKS